MNSKLYTRFYSNEGACDTFGSKTFAVKTDEGYTIHTEIPTTEAMMTKVLGCNVIGDPTEDVEKSIEAAILRHLKQLYRGKVLYNYVTDKNNPLNRDILNIHDSVALDTYIESLQED